jgi:tetratricopeptide (TPR) repeat protein
VDLRFWHLAVAVYILIAVPSVVYAVNLRIISWAIRAVHPRILEGTALVAGSFFGSREARLTSAHARACAAADTGRSGTAVARAGRMLRLSRRHFTDQCPWGFVSAAVDIFINAGRYRLALEASAAWTAEARDLGQRAEPIKWAIHQINLAEALHCLGDNRGAMALLDAAEPSCADFPLAVHGLRLMRAWLCAHLGDVATARTIMATVDSDALGPRYRSECHYTSSLIARAAGDLDVATEEARAGLRCARRAASRRNGLLALGAAAFDAGDLTDAITSLEAFARHPYQGQSGPGLLLLASAYQQSNRQADSLAARAWAAERDPECAVVTS